MDRESYLEGRNNLVDYIKYKDCARMAQSTPEIITSLKSMVVKVNLNHGLFSTNRYVPDIACLTLVIVEPFKVLFFALNKYKQLWLLYVSRYSQLRMSL